MQAKLESRSIWRGGKGVIIVPGRKTKGIGAGYWGGHAEEN